MLLLSWPVSLVGQPCLGRFEILVTLIQFSYDDSTVFCEMSKAWELILFLLTCLHDTFCSLMLSYKPWRALQKICIYHSKRKLSELKKYGTLFKFLCAQNIQYYKILKKMFYQKGQRLQTLLQCTLFLNCCTVAQLIAPLPCSKKLMDSNPSLGTLCIEFACSLCVCS